MSWNAILENTPSNKNHILLVEFSDKKILSRLEVFSFNSKSFWLIYIQS